MYEVNQTRTIIDIMVLKCLISHSYQPRIFQEHKGKLEVEVQKSHD